MYKIYQGEDPTGTYLLVVCDVTETYICLFEGVEGYLPKYRVDSYIRESILNKELISEITNKQDIEPFIKGYELLFPECRKDT